MLLQGERDTHGSDPCRDESPFNNYHDIAIRSVGAPITSCPELIANLSTDRACHTSKRERCVCVCRLRPAMTVRIVEVGPRDGLQNVKAAIPTSTKLQLIERLRQTGLQTIELTSAVSPKAIPQLADCRDLLSSSPLRALLGQQRQ